jgi:serine/threonine protein phosphatase 1
MAMLPAPATLPPGQRIYAIGDVHGCLGHLVRMHRLIEADLALRPVAEPIVLHIGDYLDRGPDSAGVIERLCRGWPAPGVRQINLCGNHEDMALAALAGGSADDIVLWRLNGGGATLASWGASGHADPRLWADLLPAEHVAFLRSLPLTFAAGGYLFVHAGLRPGVPLAEQSRFDMLWIREPFLSWRGELPAVVVHGHTPDAEAVVRRNRIGIDTGAVMGGVLTCAVLEADRVGFLQVGRGGSAEM